jgi:hypothetical protein
LLAYVLRVGVDLSRLPAALERLHPALPPEAITAAVNELIRDRSAMSREAANRKVSLLLKKDMLVVIELKKPGVPARAAFDENLTHYKQQSRRCSDSTRCSSPRSSWQR